MSKDMKKLRVIIEPMKTLIKDTEWAKKGLASKKIDLVGLCEFGCSYCSSNSNRWHGTRGRDHRHAVKEQTGTEATPYTHPYLSYHFPDVVGQLRQELAGKKKTWGLDKQGQPVTLAFGCLVDNFSPSLVRDGLTRACLEMVLESTSFRVRVTTKNAVVGSDEWIEFFRQWGDRIVINISIGTTDDDWARRVEIGTSKPGARIRAMRQLQDAGVPTAGMLCPIFPAADVDALLDAIRPDRCEVVWAEPYNDRTNWSKVTGDRDTEAELARMFGPHKDPDAWSAYAVDLYKHLRLRAEADGWTNKLVYMLYEASMSAAYARTFADLRGVILQSINKKTGRSTHPVFAELQDRLHLTREDRLMGPSAFDRVAAIQWPEDWAPEKGWPDVEPGSDLDQLCQRLGKPALTEDELRFHKFIGRK